MKLKIIKSFILFSLTVIVGVLILQSISWLLLVSSEGSFTAAGVLFVVSLLTIQLLTKKFALLKKYRKWIILSLFTGLFLLPAVAIGGSIGLIVITTPLIYYAIERKIRAPTSTLTEIMHVPQVPARRKRFAKKTQKLNYVIDSENGVIAVRHKGRFHLFALYNIDLLVKIDVLENLLKKLFENNCNVRSLELVRWEDKISIVLTLGTQNLNYFKALTKLEEEELLLTSILKANKINYRKLEEPFNLELAYLGPVLFTDYFHHGVIKNYQLTPVNFSEIEDVKTKLISNKGAHIIFLIRKIDSQLFEKEKQRILEELKNSLGLSEENNASTIALMTLISKEGIEETLDISDLKERLQKLKELEEKGLWYINPFIFEHSKEKPEGVPIPFVLRRLVYKRAEDSYKISGYIQNAAVSLLNSLSLATSMKSNNT